MAINYFVSLKAANAENQRLSAALTAHTAESDTLKAALAERDAAAESCRAQFDATVADLTEKLSVANAAAEKLQADAKSAGQQAAEVIAAQGLPASALPQIQASAPAATADDLAAKIRAESDPAKRAALFAQLQTVWKSKN